MNKKTAVTKHGEVEYETVECSSCGNKTPKEKAEQFVIGEPTSTRVWEHSGNKKFEFDLDSLKEGWACEFCKESPASYPTKDGNKDETMYNAQEIWIAVGIAFFLGLIVAVVLL